MKALALGLVALLSPAAALAHGAGGHAHAHPHPEPSTLAVVGLVLGICAMAAGLARPR